MHWLAAFPSDHWRASWDPTLSDRTSGADAATAAYLVTTVLCALATMRARAAAPTPPGDSHPPDIAPTISRPMDAQLWLALSLCLALLCITRLFDIGNLVTSIGRAGAVRTGWYAHRRPIQLLALLGLAALSWRSLRRMNHQAFALPPRLRHAACATLLLVAFAMMRALSWHYLDKALGKQVHGVRLGWLIELAGTALVATFALLELKPRERASPL